MRLVRSAIHHPITVLMASLAALLFGLVALGRLPLNLLPDITYPSLTVETELPDAAPEEVERLLTQPIEEAVGVVNGLRRIRSRSVPGLSQITLEFSWATDMDYASLDVREKIDMIDLPDDATSPILLRFDPSLDPILRIGVYGEPYGSPNLIALRHIAERQIKKELESLDGVAAVRVSGGLEEEIHVNVDGGRLAGLGLAIGDVGEALRTQNVNASGGRLRDRQSEFLVRALNEFGSLADIKATVVSDRDGRTVRVGDVANVERGHRERDVLTRIEGKESVEVAIFKEGDANTVTVAERVNRHLRYVEDELPEGVELRVLFDQADYIGAAVREVQSNAMLGGLLAVLVLFLFLRHVRSTLTIAVSIPLSIIATFILMNRFGVTLNIMSLGGLALGVGMLVDNSIVVLESIGRQRESGLDTQRAADEGASQVGKAVVAATMTTIAVFLPIIFVEGIAGQLFGDLALTVTASLLVSLLVALTVMPAIAGYRRRRALGEAAEREGRAARGGDAAEREGRAAGGGDADDMALGVPARRRRLAWLAAPFRLLGRGGRLMLRGIYRLLLRPLFRLGRRIATLVGWAVRLAAQVAVAAAWLGSRLVKPMGAAFDAGYERLAAAYGALLDRSLARPWRVLALTAVLLVLSVGLASQLGFELIPPLAQGEFTFELELPEGTPLAVTALAVESLEEELADDPRLEVYFARIGEAERSGGASEKSESRAQLGFAVRHRGDRRLEAAVIEDIRARLAERPAIDATFSRPTYFSFKKPIEIYVFGYDLDELYTVSGEVLRVVEGIPGLKDAERSLELGSPEVQILFDRQRIAALGLDLAGTSSVLRNQVRGEVVTRYKERDRRIDIRVREVGSEELELDEVGGLVVTQVEGVPVVLASVADVSIERGPAHVERIDQQRAAVISANLSGRDLGSVSRDIGAALAKLPLPPHVEVSLGGQNEELETSFRSLMLAILLAILLVYMVLASQFESLLHPFVIMFSVPLGAIGVVLALWLTGTAVSVVVLVGVIMLAGIVVNNAIVLIDYVNQRRRQGLERLAALAEGGRIRLRPILMTTATTVLGLTPMALGLGEGAEIRAPMAVAVIGGLLTSTLLTLVVIPCLYAVMDRGDA